MHFFYKSFSLDPQQTGYRNWNNNFFQSICILLASYVIIIFIVIITVHFRKAIQQFLLENNLSYCIWPKVKILGNAILQWEYIRENMLRNAQKWKKKSKLFFINVMLTIQRRTSWHNFTTTSCEKKMSNVKQKIVTTDYFLK